MKTSNAAWMRCSLSVSLPIGFSIPLDDRGTASADGRASQKDGATGSHRQAQVKGTCRLTGLCGYVGGPKSQDVSCREPDALGPALGGGVKWLPRWPHKPETAGSIPAPAHTPIGGAIKALSR